MRSLTPILEEGVFSLRFGSIGADVAEESFSFMGFNGNLKQTTGFSGIQMPCSVPASLSPTPVSRRNSNPVGPSAGRQSSPSAASVVVGVNLNLDDGDDFRPARFQAHRRLDRCLSEPTTTAAQQSSRSNSRSNSGAGTNSNSSRYKTELCRAFEETGHCKYGEKCQFAHGHQELRTINRHRKYKTELCRTYHTIGFCPYGPRCHFIHNAEEARTKPSQAPRPLSMSSSSSSSNSSPTHTDSLSGSPTSSSFTMFWAPGDEDRLRLDSPPSAASYRCLNNNCADLDIFVVKPGVAVEYPEFMVTSPGPNSTVNININNNNLHHHSNINNNVLTAMAPRLPVFSRLAGTDADPADR